MATLVAPIANVKLASKKIYMTSNAFRIWKLIYQAIGYFAIGLSLLWGGHNIVSRMDIDYQSPYDELSHFDYWYKIYSLNTIPSIYADINIESLQIWNCRQNSTTQNLCEKIERFDNKNTGMENTATPYLPTYYIATSIVSKILGHAGQYDDLFELAKISNMIWGLLGLILIWMTAKSLKIPKLLIALLIAIVAQTPAYIYMSNTFNPEIFVLISCLFGLYIYATHLYSNNDPKKFVIWASLLSAAILTIKPTALILIITISISEILNTQRGWHQRVIRSILLGITTITLYAGIQWVINYIRGGKPSNGIMRDSLIKQLGERDFIESMKMAYAQFFRSNGSPNWRAFIDWDLPPIFLYTPEYVAILFILAMIYLLISLANKHTPSQKVSLFIGSVISCAALPAFLYVYLRLVDFPFFFQARYFLPYLVICTILATSFIAYALRSAMARLQHRYLNSNHAIQN